MKFLALSIFSFVVFSAALEARLCSLLPDESQKEFVDELVQSRVRSLVAELASPTAERREQILEEIKTIGAVSISPLAQAMKSPNRKLRLNAAEALAVLGKPAIPALVDLLRNSKDDGVRRQAAWALGNMDEAPISAIEDLRVAATRDEKRFVRWRSIVSLGMIGYPARSTVPDLILLAQDPDPMTRSVSVEALIKINDASKEQVDLFVKLLGDSNLNVRRAAIFGLGQFGQLSKDALPRLEQIESQDLEATVRLDARLAIRQIKNSRDIDEL